MISISHDLVAVAKAPELHFRKRATVALAALFLVMLGVFAITSTPSRKNGSEELILFRRSLFFGHFKDGDSPSSPTSPPTGSPTVSPTYVVSPGIAKNVPQSVITGNGWNECWTGNYKNPLTSAIQDSMIGDCQGKYVMYGCRPAGRTNWQVVGFGNRDKAFTEVEKLASSGTQDGDIQWYNSDGYSMGFAPAGVDIELDACDVAGINGGGEQDHRLCWQIDAGGYSCGNNAVNATTGMDYDRAVWTYGS
jgi:hypothetical protein